MPLYDSQPMEKKFNPVEQKSNPVEFFVPYKQYSPGCAQLCEHTIWAVNGGSQLEIVCWC
jgi:hypothetical protein